ncbi:MAG TPA: peptidoglycan-binding protein [Pseudonocardiaceae bacterium]
MSSRVVLARLLTVALFASLLAVAGAAAGAGPASACTAEGPSAAFARTLPDVRYGSTGTAVVGLQLRLRAEGYGLTGTGWFGPNTRAAVRDYQRASGLTVDGWVGQQTWQHLVGRIGRAGTEAPPVPADGLWPGERDQAGVDTVGIALWRMGLDAEPGAGAGGRHDAALQRAVRDFQVRAGIVPSGIVGNTTWHAMFTVVSIRGGWGC